MINHAGYQNFGGVGVTFDTTGELDGLKGNERGNLTLRNSAGQVIAERTATDPWTVEAISSELDGLAELTDLHSPVDAYLGSTFLGSTEL